MYGKAVKEYKTFQPPCGVFLLLSLKGEGVYAGTHVSTPLRGFFVAEGTRLLHMVSVVGFNPLAGFFCC